MDKHDPKEHAARLLKEAGELQSRLNLRSTEQERSSILKDLRFVGRTIRNIREACGAFSEYILAPALFVLGPPLRFITKRYRRIWHRFAYIDDKLSGERIISKRRAGILMVLTALFLFAFTPTRIGEAVRFFTVEPVSDSIFMAVSLRTEIFFLNSSQEVNSEENVHSVRGCHFQGICEEHDAVYFRVHHRLSHDIWKLAKYGNPIYVPDHVVAPIAPGVNRCEVTYYGYRITSSWIARILRSLQVYPTMLEASCTHVMAGT